MFKIESLEEKVAKRAQFFSDITGLNIIHQDFIPVNPGHIPKKEGQITKTVPFEYNLSLGPKGENYLISFYLNLVHDVDDFNSWSGWDIHEGWSVRYNGEKLSEAGWGSPGLRRYEMTPENVRDERLETLLRALGNVTSEIPFMNYEQYTLNSLNDNDQDSYFKNIYLVIMCHMKERGLEMPPILLNLLSPERAGVNLWQAMDSGDITRVEEIMNRFDTSKYERRNRKHIAADMEEIRSTTLYQNQKLSLDIPFVEKFPEKKFINIPGNREGHAYNILIVESGIYTFGQLTDKVERTLTNADYFGGSSLVEEFRLHPCMLMAETGQIDLILFDWVDPAYHEVFWIDATSSSSPPPIEGEDEFNVLHQFGYINEKEMEERAKELNIRQLWMDKIAKSCHSRGHEEPPYYIFRSRDEYNSIHEIIKDRLNID